MFKRTKGYFLLTMLVLTGLAGRMHTTILTTKERLHLVTELKTSKKDLLKSVEGLSAKQLNFKADKNQLSIKECIYRVASIEKQLWLFTQVSLRQEPSSSIQKTASDDNALMNITVQKNDIPYTNLNFKNTREAIKFYKNERAQMLRYVQTSTQNVRAHISQTPMGNFDAYQLILFNTIYSKLYVQQIEEIKTHPDFPN